MTISTTSSFKSGSVLSYLRQYSAQYFSTVTSNWKVHGNYFLATVVRIIDVSLIDGSTIDVRIMRARMTDVRIIDASDDLRSDNRRFGLTFG